MKLNRSSAYVPIFRSTPASITDAGVGACTWASGSHVCSGTIGTFTANPTNIAKNATTFSVSAPRPNVEPKSLAASAAVTSIMSKESTFSANTSATNPMNIRRLATFV